MKIKDNQQKGFVHALFLLSVLGLIAFLLISNTFTFKDELFGYLFPKPASFAAGPVALNLAPAQLTVTTNNQFNLDVVLEPNGEQVTAAEIKVTFDPQKFQAISISSTSAMPMVLVPGSVGSGTASITVGSNLGTSVNTTATVATIVFKALQATTTSSAIVVDNTSQVASLGKSTNMAGIFGVSQVTVTDSATTDGATFSLTPANTTELVGVEFPVSIRVRNDSVAANLYVAKLSFDPSVMSVVRIDKTSTFITQWPEEYYNNTTGEISVVGGLNTPGFKTQGADATMFKIIFKGKVGTSSPSPVNFTSSAAILADADNRNILTTKNGSNISFRVPTQASPTPQSSANPTSLPTSVPTNVASPLPTAEPTPTASPIAGVPCSISSATWGSANVSQGNVVTLNVVGSGDCTGKSVAYAVRENDSVAEGGIDDDASIKPADSIFGSGNNSTSTTWVAEFQNDCGGFCNPPEYFFVASVINGQTPSVRSADPLLTVQSTGNIGTPIRGDANLDGQIDLVDLSALLSNYCAATTACKSTLPAAVDFNNDELVNTFDYSEMINLLINRGVIRVSSQ